LEVTIVSSVGLISTPPKPVGVFPSVCMGVWIKPVTGTQEMLFVISIILTLMS